MPKPVKSPFKAYDIRGCARTVLTEDFAIALGRGAAQTLAAKTALIGYDARLSSPQLAQALARGLKSEGCRVASLGMCGTEELYYAASQGEHDLSIMVTGSHNPAHENGFKFIRDRAIPISRDSGLREIELATWENLRHLPSALPSAEMESANYRPKHGQWLLEYSGLNLQSEAADFAVLVDAGNGCAGLLLQELLPKLPFTVIPRNLRPDGCFPHGVPNPLLPERRAATAQAVQATGVRLGVAFDGDFDRCFFFDERGNMAEACYLIGPLAAHLLRSAAGAAIVHDTRVYWLIRQLVQNADGKPIMGKGGHSFMKETMRRENALFGGEMSAHYFFRDFAFCDGGMLTFCLLAALLLDKQQSLADLVADGCRRYPVSGEINFRVSDTAQVIKHLESRYVANAQHVDHMDGINVEYAQWRFNVRGSNTEPLLRLNVEARGDADLVAEKVAELRKEIGQFQE